MRPVLRPRSTILSFAIAAALALSSERAFAQAAVITGRVTSDAGVALQGANVFITELNVSVGTNENGQYTINIPPARISGQTVQLRVRSVGFLPQNRPITLAAGAQTVNFGLKADINRLSEVVVTGTVGGATERAKVPYAIAQLSPEDMPVPAVDPITQISAKMPGVRIAQTSGRPGSNPDIMIRGPKSINAQGRNQRPVVVVDGAIMNFSENGGSLDEIGGLDIESVEVVRGAAGASLYGSSAANGVIVIKTKRGSAREGVQVSLRSEYGFSDLNSFDYGQPINHPLQLDETGKRFCVVGSSNVASCSRTVDWMKEIMRINNVAADTLRTPFTIQGGTPGLAGGDLQNIYQSNIWPGQYYNGFAQVATYAPTLLNSIDASGKTGSVRYFASASQTVNKGAVKDLNGTEHLRGRVNLDYSVRPDITVSASTMYDRGYIDQRTGGSSNGGVFGQLLRGAPSGTDYLAVDTLGRPIVRGGHSRPTGNGAGTFLYDMTNRTDDRFSNRFLGSLSSSYFPTDWLTIDGLFTYDGRDRQDRTQLVKGYRTFTASSQDNNGRMTLNDVHDEAYNAALSASLRRQLTRDLNGKLVMRTSYEREDFVQNEGRGQAFIAKDIYTITNTTINKTATSIQQSIRNIGLSAATSFDFKDRYIVDAAIRYDGSSLFGEGERWAPFGRVSAVWRVSQEPFWKLDQMSDFRLRASRGTAGGRPRFSAQYETYNITATGPAIQQAGNSKLKPETTTETEVGTDFTLFNRLGVEATYAFSDTRDQILEVNTPSSLGFATQWQNAGTLSNKTWEVALNLPVINKRDVSWSLRGTWDRTRTYITELFAPEYVTDGGTTQGTGSFFLVTARKDKSNGFPVNRFGNIWGRKFYRGCGQLPESVRGQCGEGKAYQVNDQGWVVWTGEGNSWRDGITKNLWQTNLPAAQSPWNQPLYFGHPIVDRPLRGQPGEKTGILQVLGNTLPDYRFTIGNNFRYKKLSVYAALDATIGHDINNQGEGWGLLDLSSSYFDQGGRTVETAKPVGYGWRAGGSEAGGTGGFYDLLGPNNYNVEDGSYAKIREVNVSYNFGRLRGIGDVTLGVVGRNLYTFTNYSGYDPETGATGGNNDTVGLINQTDAFGFPTLRSFTFMFSTRF